MVAKITTPRSIQRALNYNEKKIQNGNAECISAANFLWDLKDMSFYDKLEVFQDRIALNQRAATNTMHISLNFHPSEKLDNEQLSEIAAVYMDKIGFGQQPYLVYRHEDAAHPHIHIVTTSIRENGSRINTYNIGRNQSEKARKQIEISFGLIKAEGRDFRKTEGLAPVNAQKVKYGLSVTKRSIVNVLDAVLDQYKYTSVAELNAVLKQYNIMADRGKEEGRIFRYGGLTYRVLDNDGKKVGVPVKASAIYSKPTLAYLEERFQKNEGLRQPFRQSLKNAIDWTLQRKPISLTDFLLQLQREKVTGIPRRNDQGLIYGITFIDHRSKCVFNGSDIGKSYSAAALQERICQDLVTKTSAFAALLKKQSPPNNMPNKELPFKEHIRKTEQYPQQNEKTQMENSSVKRNDLLDILLRSGKDSSRVPYELMKKKKKKRKPGL